MRKIKRLVEFFDDEDFRSQYEIPYLKGEMPEVISKFKNYDSSEDVRFLDAVRFQFPALNLFHYKDTKKGEFTIHFLYATSLKPVDGINYYASLTITHLKNEYVVVTLFRELKETDKKEFDTKEHRFKDIHSAYPVIEKFLKRCEELNIMENKHNFNLQSN